MAISTQRSGQALAVSRALLARLGAKAHGVLKTLQMARMLSTLADMSDHQLAQIGISRADIPKYAEELMTGE